MNRQRAAIELHMMEIFQRAVYHNIDIFKIIIKADFNLQAKHEVSEDQNEAVNATMLMRENWLGLTTNCFSLLSLSGLFVVYCSFYSSSSSKTYLKFGKFTPNLAFEATL